MMSRRTGYFNSAHVARIPKEFYWTKRYCSKGNWTVFETEFTLLKAWQNRNLNFSRFKDKKYLMNLLNLWETKKNKLIKLWFPCQYSIKFVSQNNWFSRFGRKVQVLILYRSHQTIWRPKLESWALEKQKTSFNSKRSCGVFIETLSFISAHFSLGGFIFKLCTMYIALENLKINIRRSWKLIRFVSIWADMPNWNVATRSFFQFWYFANRKPLS